MADTTFSDAASGLFQKVAEAYIRDHCQHHERWHFCYRPEAADALAELVAHKFLEPRGVEGRTNTVGLTPLGERAILLSLIPVPTSEQRIAINLVADHVLARREPFTKLFLQKKIEGTAQQEGLGVNATALLDSVDSTYLDAVEKYPNYRYDLTTIGWLASKHRPKIDLLIGGVLQLFRERLAEQSLHPYTWQELQDRGLVSDDSERYFVEKILGLLGLSRGQTADGWNLPADRDLESLLKYEDPAVLLTDKWLAWIRSHVGFRSMMLQDPMAIFSDYDPFREIYEALEPLKDEIAMDGIRVFVSHSAKDASLAKALVDCLEACLEVPDKAIRCTSVPGYKLAPGDVSDAVLRENIEQCSVVIGLLTEESLKSGYVIMELGAAWGLNKTTCALLAPSVEFKRVPGPLARTHAVMIDKDHDMVSVMEVIADKTGWPLRNRARSTAAMNAFLEAVQIYTAKKDP